jgi:hypothetical protein
MCQSLHGGGRCGGIGAEIAGNGISIFEFRSHHLGYLLQSNAFGYGCHLAFILGAPNIISTFSLVFILHQYMAILIPNVQKKTRIEGMHHH